MFTSDQIQVYFDFEPYAYVSAKWDSANDIYFLDSEQALDAT